MRKYDINFYAGLNGVSAHRGHKVNTAIIKEFIDTLMQVSVTYLVMLVINRKDSELPRWLVITANVFYVFLLVAGYMAAKMGG